MTHVCTCHTAWLKGSRDFQYSLQPPTRESHRVTFLNQCLPSLFLSNLFITMTHTLHSKKCTHCINCSAQDCNISSANALEIPQSYTKPSASLCDLHSEYKNKNVSTGKRITHWDRDKTVAILQTTFSCTKIVEFWFKFSLKFVPKATIDPKSGLVQMMAWHQTGDKPLSEPMTS